jgi:putative peptide zinc metalloprotease protein
MELIIGPGLMRGPKAVYLIKDAQAGRCYEVGIKEHFVLCRLDGTRTLEDIGVEYMRRFGRRLGEDSWQQLLGLLATRRLLAGTALQQSGQPQVRPQSARRPRGARIVFGNPSALVARAHQRLTFLFSPHVLLPLVAAVVSMEVLLATHLPQALGDSRVLVAQPELLVLILGLMLVSSGLHEFAHGLTCWHFGGNVTEMGMRWGGAVMYSKIDDVRLFTARRKRVATSAVGVLANLVFLLPFVPLWLLLPPADDTRRAIGALLLFGSARALANYLPWLGLDGYLMLSNALNVVDLAEESRRYVRLLAGDVVGHRRETAAYPRWLQVVYLGYVAISLALVGALVVGVLSLLVPLVAAPLRTGCTALVCVVGLVLAANSVGPITGGRKRT